jgi:hypothetical protein
MGLAPGDYTVRLDKNQLKKVQMTADPEYHRITILRSREGDLAGGLEFVLTTHTGFIAKPDSSGPGFLPVEMPGQKEEPGGVRDQLGGDSLVVPVTDSNEIVVQAASFYEKKNAQNAKIQLETMVNKPVSVDFESGVYYVRIHGISIPDSARNLLITLPGKGFPDASILKKPTR